VNQGGAESGSLKFSAVPEAPDSPKLDEHGLGNVIHESTMQSKAKRCAADERERDVIARDVDPLESVVLLEVAQAVTLFVPLGEPRVDEV